jgi:hypothetical protein
MAAYNHDFDSEANYIVFREARDRFLNSLAEKDRSRFSECSVDQLLSDIEGFEKFAQNKRKWITPLKRIKDFSDKLQPYFEICSIVLQSHPEWSAIVWGAFRLILQVSPCVPQ